jgi:hypothetical protein
VSDECTIPVRRLHHRELHRYGDEASWWAAANIDPLPIALLSYGSVFSIEVAAKDGQLPTVQPPRTNCAAWSAREKALAERAEKTMAEFSEDSPET